MGGLAMCCLQVRGPDNDATANEKMQNETHRAKNRRYSRHGRGFRGACCAGRRNYCHHFVGQEREAQNEPTAAHSRASPASFAQSTGAIAATTSAGRCIVIGDL